MDFLQPLIEQLGARATKLELIFAGRRTAAQARSSAPLLRARAARLTREAGTSFDGPGRSGGSSGTGSRDPLVFGPNRIPQQNLPLPDRGGIGTKGKADPPGALAVLIAGQRISICNG